MQKDKPIYAPLRVLRPGWFANPSDFSFGWAFGWWILVQGIAWLEPLPTDLQIKFDLKYLALTHLCAMAGQVLLPIFAIGLVPKSPPGGRIPTLLRLSFGSSLWFLWTFPLAFLLTDSKGAIVLALGRELLWAVSLSIGIIGLRENRSGFGKAVLGTGCAVGIFLGSIVFATIPDWSSLSNLKMDNIGTGRICKGVPQLPATRVDSADWLVSGSPKLVSSERLSLGDRQRILAGFDGQILVRVATGPTPAPEDTSGSTATSTTDGPILEAMLSTLPISVTDNSRLLALHGMVHRSIRYDRSYFPGTTEQILTRKTGDCKAYAQVFCAGARRLGFPARVVHGLLASHDGYYAHAWVTVKSSDGWQDWDPTSSEPSPDARYLRFTAPKEASGAFDGELAIFALDSIVVRPASVRSTF
ncbi:MAG: transglutaminase-like domain-containing protein [Fibrobacterota bacterium]